MPNPTNAPKPNKRRNDEASKVSENGTGAVKPPPAKRTSRSMSHGQALNSPNEVAAKRRNRTKTVHEVQR